MKPRDPAAVVIGALVAAAVVLLLVTGHHGAEDWNVDEWVRAGETIFVWITGGVYVHSVYQIALHLWLEPRQRRVTGFERRLHTGRCIRNIAVLWFLAGATHALLSRFDAALTFRSVCWVLGTTCAFIAWTMLDRRRWEVGLT